MAAWDALPAGHFDALYQGKRWGVTRTVRTGGRQGWIWAEQRGGTARVSGNIYRLQKGATLKPCEMPAKNVIDFIMKARPMVKTR